MFIILLLLFNQVFSYKLVVQGRTVYGQPLNLTQSELYIHKYYIDVLLYPVDWYQRPIQVNLTAAQQCNPNSTIQIFTYQQSDCGPQYCKRRVWLNCSKQYNMPGLLTTFTANATAQWAYEQHGYYNGSDVAWVTWVRQSPTPDPDHTIGWIIGLSCGGGFILGIAIGCICYAQKMRKKRQPLIEIE